jgi:uncharacterized OsmC-like protein
VPDAIYRVTGQSDDTTKLTISVRKFQFVLDEPPALEGRDEAPSPVEHLLGGLCGCINVTLKRVAKEMGIEVRNVQFKATGRLDPAKFLGKSSEGRAGYKGMQVDIQIDTDADQPTIDRLIAATEERCPLSDNIGEVTPIRLDARAS